MSERDVELYHLVQQGDKQALEALYDRYEKLLFSFSYRMTGSSDISEEAIQEVFIKLWTKKGLYKEEKGKFSSWLLTVTRNTCLDLLKKKKETTYTLEERDAIQANDPSTEDIIQWKEEGQNLREAVQELAEDQRKIVELFYFKGLSQRQISEACNIPLGTVKGRVRLALKHLRKYISNTTEGEVE
ncbi:sigma-70 family RNA polymerase sigma factor [Radiobacillus kanasensis]|uniref:RNA polymerase sigma factor n=1 Tax=Radiobacillus kanasensis TaxID=2844358 RepID=UPI001E5C9BA8|nr:sigma-70 family RNA polymerase sigma factor [Radiobacillus kanasensis]UFT99056.1 sigma-70 family RNA polymerase sigma factor [Radiobacillus kanasensis]